MPCSPDPTLFFSLVGDCSYPLSEITNNGLQKKNRHHQQSVKEQTNKTTPATFQEFLQYTELIAFLKNYVRDLISEYFIATERLERDIISEIFFQSLPWRAWYFFSFSFSSLVYLVEKNRHCLRHEFKPLQCLKKAVLFTDVSMLLMTTISIYISEIYKN